MTQIQTLFDDGDEHVGGDGDPYLRLHRVLAGAQERLYAQVLLDPFERLSDIVPIGTRFQKLLSGIAFIRIMVKLYRLSGGTTYTGNHVTSCGYQTASPGPFQPG